MVFPKIKIALNDLPVVAKPGSDDLFDAFLIKRIKKVFEYLFLIIKVTVKSLARQPRLLSYLCHGYLVITVELHDLEHRGCNSFF